MSTSTARIETGQVELVPGTLAAMLRNRSLHLGLGSTLIAAIIIWLYHGVLAKLALDWWTIPEASHGILVVIFFAYLLWTRRHKIADAQLAPSWSGLFVIAVGLTLLLLGNLGAELFLSRVSLLFLATGLTLLFGGKGILRDLAFPLLVLLFAIPLPTILLNRITLPLQMVASRGASELLPLFGLPVMREGNVIVLPSMQLEVAEACSGIRSLVSLAAVSVFYGYFTMRSNVRRGLLLLLSIPIAIVVNSLRIVGTGLCVQYWDPDKALGFFHEFSGWVMFLLSLVLLFVAQKTISRIWKEKQP